MRKTYKKLKRSLKSSALVSHLNDTVKVIFPSNLMFGFNSASINEPIIPKMQRFALALNKFDRTAVLISGHTDNKGAEQYNNELSGRRADSAKVVLSQYQVKPERINTWGMGMRHPVASNETDEGRALNRRVEFVILYKE
ncbi:MAG TPA: OmpA family protein [Chitinophagaceae bacterium]|nr:OmpA family protein [Chitinophagaceae bacterium]